MDLFSTHSVSTATVMPFCKVLVQPIGAPGTWVRLKGLVYLLPQLYLDFFINLPNNHRAEENWQPVGSY